MNARLLFLHALSPLHAGTGQGAGVVDLPIARERATHLPIVPGSSLKGVLRDRCQDNEDESGQCDQIFGTADQAGRLQISDQRLLLLPVRSLRGTFAWTTSPFILRRLTRDLKDAGAGELPSVPEPRLELERAECAIAPGSALAIDGQVFLEDLDLIAATDTSEAACAWAQWIGDQLFTDEEDGWRAALRQRLCIVPDDVMAYLAELGTEVAARVRLADSSKTVARGGLWYEEALPAETVLTGLVLAQPRGSGASGEIFDLLDRLTGKPLQLGGDATVGRGLCRVRVREV